MLVVDSGSSDGSLEVARGHGARVHEIPPSEFGHGRTRNLGATLAAGEILVFTSQDAYAADETWLARLVAPLAGGVRFAGVYGRQLPHDDATPPERYFLDFLYGPEPRVQRLEEGEGEPDFEQTLFSNVNSAIPHAVWREFPFADDLIMSEDQEWSRRVLQAGYELVYEPRAAVHHSHRVLHRGCIPALLRLRRLRRALVRCGRRRLGGAAAGRRTVRARRGRMAVGDRAAPLDPLRRRLRAREVHGDAARSPPPAPAARRSSAGSAHSRRTGTS